MPVIPLLPLFHKFNSQYFENSLAVNNQPLVRVRWSDNRLKTTAGFYKRKRINGFVDSEIILSKPILSKLSTSEINSTLCHEMIRLVPSFVFWTFQQIYTFFPIYHPFSFL